MCVEQIQEVRRCEGVTGHIMAIDGKKQSAVEESCPALCSMSFSRCERYGMANEQDIAIESASNPAEDNQFLCYRCRFKCTSGCL